MRETKWWVWHMIAGAAILILGGLHMMVMHMDGALRWFNPYGPEAIEWDNVVVRAKEIFFAVTYILLLGTGLFHGLYGLRTMLLETKWGLKARRAVSGILIILGLGLFVVGTYAAIAAQNIR